MKIIRKAFETWLSENPRRRFLRRKACACPIAAYLKALGAPGTVTVGMDTFYHDGAPREFQLPEWASEFISAVDRVEGDYVSGRRALEILKEVDLS